MKDPRILSFDNAKEDTKELEGFVLRSLYTGKFLGIYESYQKAEWAAGEMFDKNNEIDDFLVEQVEDGKVWYRERMRAYSFMKTPCPICGKDVRSRYSLLTYDYNGIPFRKVCPDCHYKVMEINGFDGELYSEFDECMDYDY